MTKVLMLQRWDWLQWHFQMKCSYCMYKMYKVYCMYKTFFLPRHIENVFLSHIKFWLICLAEWYIILKSKSNWQDLF